MSAAAVGRPQPRAADAYVDDEKWFGYVLSKFGHGRHWREAFGTINPDELWSTIAHAVLNAKVTEVREVEVIGFSCRVPLSLTTNDRPRQVRTIWHYEHDDGAPRLVTAYPNHLTATPWRPHMRSRFTTWSSWRSR